MDPQFFPVDAIVDMACVPMSDHTLNGIFFDNVVKLTETYDLTQFKKILVKVLKRKKIMNIPRIKILQQTVFEGISVTPDPFQLFPIFSQALLRSSGCESEILFDNGDAAACKLSLGKYFDASVIEKIEEIFSQSVHEESRHTWLTHDSAIIDYRHSGKVHKSRPYPDGLLLIEKFLFQFCRLFINDNIPHYQNCLRAFKSNSGASHYSSKKGSYLGYHDDSDFFTNNKLIFSFSVMSTCSFGIKKKKSDISWKTTIEPLDLFIMVGKNFQKKYVHSVLETYGPRINISFRQIKKCYCQTL